MAETYEYPPSLNQYRPINFMHGAHHHSSLKLRHHFFLTRVKIVFKEVFKVMRVNPPKADCYLQDEVENVLISQGWCAALGAAVPTPFFIQQYLLMTVGSSAFGMRECASLVKILLSVEVSDLDRRFHDDIMGGKGSWWVDDTKRPLPFRTLWRMLEQRSTDLVNAGLLSPNVSDPGRSAELSANVLIDETSRARSERKDERKKTKEELDRLAELMGEIGLEEIEISKEDVEDLEHIEEVVRTRSQLERMKDIEAEIVETERWNLEASKTLLELALKQEKMPFESRAELFDLHPTADDGNQAEQSVPGPSSAKGKEQAEDSSVMKRAIYHLLPAQATDSWLGMSSNTNLPPMPVNAEDNTTIEELLNKTFPELIASEQAPHSCVYRDLLGKFVTQDLRRQATDRLEEFLSAEESATSTSFRTWRNTFPPVVNVPATGYNAKADPIPGMFERIAAMAQSAVRLPTSNAPASPSGNSQTASGHGDSDSGASEGSEWESEESMETGMDMDTVMDVEVLPPGVDTGGSYFATSNTI